MNNKVLVEVQDIYKYFRVHRGIFKKQTKNVHAVDGVSFTINRGETFGLVGESGCGKSTTARLILRLLEPTRGKVIFDGIDLFSLDNKEMREMRKRMQIIFQDPYSSMDPRMSVADIIGEPLRIHYGYSFNKEKVQELLSLVGLNLYYADRFPHELSGGQRQRIGIARALALNPDLIVCDEAVSALDVSIRSQILNLLLDLQQEFNLTYLFISHDLSVIKHISHHVAVMYLGKVVERSSKKELFDNPRHPYTKALLSAIPIPDPAANREQILLHGDVPSPVNPPPGCRFHTRCNYKTSVCEEREPELREVEGNHFVACHMVE